MKTSRLTLRRLIPADDQLLQELESDLLVMQFTPSRVPQTMEQTKNRLEKHLAQQPTLEPFGFWAADLTMAKRLIGWLMLLPHGPNQLELGFMLHQNYWRTGLTTEACRRLIEYAATYDQIKSIIANTDLENQASIKTLERLGFSPTELITVDDRVYGGEVTLQSFILQIRF